MNTNSFPFKSVIASSNIFAKIGHVGPDFYGSLENLKTDVDFSTVH